jgi:hypothetical protein
MTTVILNSTDKNFIFEFSFSPSQPLDSPPVSFTPDAMNLEAESNNDATITIGTSPLTYLEVVSYRQDYPDMRFNWAGLMKENQTIPMSVPPLPTNTTPATTTSTANKKTTSVKNTSTIDPEDDNWCKGSFHLYQNSQTGDRFVWFDLNFGPGYEAVYEGCMVQFPSSINS